jgi:hypothetical protein
MQTIFLLLVSSFLFAMITSLVNGFVNGFPLFEYSLYVRLKVTRNDKAIAVAKSDSRSPRQTDSLLWQQSFSFAKEYVYMFVLLFTLGAHKLMISFEISPLETNFPFQFRSAESKNGQKMLKSRNPLYYR